MSQDRQDYESKRNDKQDLIIERINESNIRTEELLKQVIIRALEHAEEMAKIAKNNGVQDKILESLSIKANIVQWFIITVIVALITYIVPHFIK